MAQHETDLDLARHGNRAAIEALFLRAHPKVVRISRALTGDAETADEVISTVFKHALRVLPDWRTDNDPDNWFSHHAVQRVRQINPGRPASGQDLLVQAPNVPPAYLAMIRGIRRLPGQQAEAFLLHHGERLNPRLLGVAMDCSSQAAQTHLRAADLAIELLAGDAFVPLCEQLRKAFKSLAPAADESSAFVTLHVRAWAAKRQRRRTGRILLLGLFALGLVCIWLLRDSLWHLFVP